jgi:hypothetical protein
VLFLRKRKTLIFSKTWKKEKTFSQNILGVSSLELPPLKKTGWLQLPWTHNNIYLGIFSTTKKSYGKIQNVKKSYGKIQTIKKILR